MVYDLPHQTASSEIALYADDDGMAMGKADSIQDNESNTVDSNAIHEWSEANQLSTT